MEKWSFETVACECKTSFPPPSSNESFYLIRANENKNLHDKKIQKHFSPKINYFYFLSQTKAFHDYMYNNA